MDDVDTRKRLQDYLSARAGEPVTVGDLRRPEGNGFSADTFIQHDSEMEDGLAPFKALVLAPDRPLLYDEIVLLVGQGDFVATLCRARRNGEEQAQVDLFRLEDRRIVERWDNAEPVPPREEWANSGKF